MAENQQLGNIIFRSEDDNYQREQFERFQQRGVVSTSVADYYLAKRVGYKNKLKFKSLSIVSKQFLSITNRLIFSMKIDHLHLCYLSRFFHRFSNLNSLELLFGTHNLHADIALALRSRPKLKSLSFSGFELNDSNYISHYIDSFLSLKALNSLMFVSSQISDHFLYSVAREGLPLKKFGLANCMGYSYHGIYDFLSKCHTIQHLGLQGVHFLKNHHVARLSLLLPDLISINLTECSKLREPALLALIKNCHSLVMIKMENIYIERKTVANSHILKKFDVNPQFKYLCLANTSFVNHQTILLFASVFPNLEVLDLSFCHDISRNSICQILSRCCKLRYLNLTNCENVSGLKMNSVVHQLEELDLCATNVDDETLYEISKSCCGLLKLLLTCCKYVTEKGVMRAVENCTQLEDIYLMYCDKVNPDTVVSMLSSRPSLHVW
ncbi:uncharacterized protein LOC127130185 [Lathyrus oleraceus]|uniref:uncharacterized protein LOC127130185 n=1 Tax=Pisum sativum TaxID=3888 RepID=UPI0021CEAF08|nr:uncharacterized protein LOC127130185 [Pisum sativum]